MGESWEDIVVNWDGNELFQYRPYFSANLGIDL